MARIICCCAVLLLACGPHSPQPRHPLGVQRLVVPGYPGVARAARIAGDVHMTIMVEPSGKVASVKSASGSAALKDHAAANILGWSYTPIETQAEVEVVYAYRLVPPEFEAETHPKVELETPFRIVITTNPVAVTSQQESSIPGAELLPEMGTLGRATRRGDSRGR